MGFRSFTDLVNLIETQGSALNWELLHKRCEVHKCTDVVMGYIVLVSKFYNVTLPAAILNKYSSFVTESDKKLFLHYLHGGKLQPSHVSTHSQNIANITGVLDKLRYVVEVVFPGKEFMVEKYSPLNPPQGGLKRDAQRINASSYHHIITSKFWWLWYGYRWLMVSGIWLVFNGYKELTT